MHRCRIQIFTFDVVTCQIFVVDIAQTRLALNLPCVDRNVHTACHLTGRHHSLSNCKEIWLAQKLFQHFDSTQLTFCPYNLKMMITIVDGCGGSSWNNSPRCNWHHLGRRTQVCRQLHKEEVTRLILQGHQRSHLLIC